MATVGDEQHDSRRRGWRIVVAVIGLLLTAFVARLWLFEEPVERLELEISTDATFRYSRWIDSEFTMAPKVPLDTGQAILNLIDDSERYVVKGQWTVRLDWPPIRKEYLPRQVPIAIAALDVVTADSEDRVMSIRFLSEYSFFAPTGRYIVPEENHMRLRRLLDSLDARCQAAFNEQQSETPEEILQTNGGLDHDELSGNPDGE